MANDKSILERIFQIDKELDGSIFLFGGRQTGKTTLLRQQFPDALFFDLLDSNVRRRLQQRPVLLYETLKANPLKRGVP